MNHPSALIASKWLLNMWLLGMSGSGAQTAEHQGELKE